MLVRDGKHLWPYCGFYLLKVTPRRTRDVKPGEGLLCPECNKRLNDLRAFHAKPEIEELDQR